MASHGSTARSNGSQSKYKQRKHKIIIHTSPFLRCVQSSIAVSAGMAQYHGNLDRFHFKDQDPMAKPSRLYTGPSRAQTLDAKIFDERISHESASLSSDDWDETSSQDEPEIPVLNYQKPILRVDACLGEWLSPDYYEFITAPPPSNMMVAGAKADLLRSADPLRGAKIVEHNGEVTVFPGADAAENRGGGEGERKTSFSMDAMARTLPGHEPSSPSYHTSHPTENGSVATNPQPIIMAKSTGYVAPTPTYALLQSAPIPNGYVAHARDMCLDIDFQWDSMREPQQWGDGGSYGEEWSSMHRRFRYGLSNMISWYKDKCAEFDPQDAKDAGNDLKGDEDDADVVLIIITHGAGSNALIGALTNQPVLLDVGMASLTMAVRRPQSATSPVDHPRSTSTAGSRRRRSSAVDLGMSQEYKMKVVASTEHLKAGGGPLSVPHLSSPRLMPSIPEASRAGGSTTASSGTASPIEGGNQPFSRNSALGSMRRTTVKSASSRTFSPRPLVTSTTLSGLWGSRASTRNGKLEAAPSSPGDDLTLNFTDGSWERKGGDSEEKENGVPSPQSAAPGVGRGLWGSTPKEEVSKRRWTVGARR